MVNCAFNNYEMMELQVELRLQNWESHSITYIHDHHKNWPFWCRVCVCLWILN